MKNCSSASAKRLLTTDRNATLALVLVHKILGLEANHCPMADIPAAAIKDLADIPIAAIKDLAEVHPSQAWVRFPTKKLTTLTLKKIKAL